MTTIVLLLVFALLIGGVVGSVIPGLPGAIFSLAGVGLHWWGTGYTEPGTFMLIALVVAGVLAIAVDWFGGAVAARVGGGSTRTMFAAGLVGLLLFFIAGPLGVLLGIAGTVFASEYLASGSAAGSLHTAAAATAGVLASAVVQLLVTTSMLFAMVVVVLL